MTATKHFTSPKRKMATSIADEVPKEVTTESDEIPSKSASSPRSSTRTTRSKVSSVAQSCFSLNCANTASHNPRMHFFNFPRDPQKCQKWVQNVQRLELKGKSPEEISQNYALCSDHFEDDMFVNAKQRQRLTLDAVPTIFGNVELPVEPKASTRRKRKKKQPTGTTEKSGSQKIPVYRSSSLVCHAMRVKSGEDLKFALECYINRHDLRGAFIMSCVGSIQEASLRMADSTTVVYLSSPHEILALNGTLSDGGHLHICLSDVEGKVIGGHLKSAIINTTAEIVIGELPRLELTRVMDENTSYKELVVGERKGNSEADSSGEDEDILSSSSGPNSSKRAKKRRTPKSTVKLIDNTNGTPTVLVNNTLLKITDVKL